MNSDTTIIALVDSTGADLVPLPGVPSLDHVREYVRASKAENALRGYQSDWRDLCAWCDSRGSLCALPAESVASLHRRMRRASQTGQHTAEIERDRGGAQGGRAGVAHARGHRAQHPEGHSTDSQDGARIEDSRVYGRYPLPLWTPRTRASLACKTGC
jgi:hypothetical protein